MSGPRNDADRRRFGLLVSGLGAILAVARRDAIALRRVRVLIVLPFDRFGVLSRVFWILVISRIWGQGALLFEHRIAEMLFGCPSEGRRLAETAMEGKVRWWAL